MLERFQLCLMAVGGLLALCGSLARWTGSRPASTALFTLSMATALLWFLTGLIRTHRAKRWLFRLSCPHCSLRFSLASIRLALQEHMQYIRDLSRESPGIIIDPPFWSGGVWVSMFDPPFPSATCTQCHLECRITRQGRDLVLSCGCATVPVCGETVPSHSRCVNCGKRLPHDMRLEMFRDSTHPHGLVPPGSAFVRRDTVGTPCYVARCLSCGHVKRFDGFLQPV